MRVRSKILGDRTSLEDLRHIQHENPAISIEKDVQGNLILKSIPDYYSGSMILDLLFQLRSWNQEYQLGFLMGAAAGYQLPNMAIRSPDISWISSAQIESLSQAQIPPFSSLIPDFVIELCTAEDKVADLIRKMQEYQACGVRLGWIVDPMNECCYIFRPERKHEVRFGFDQELSGEGVLVNFSLNLRRLRALR